LGGLLLNHGEAEAVVAWFRNLVRLALRNALGHGNLGTGLLARDGLDEAAACFGEALRRKPGYADAHNGLGAVVLAGYRYGDAEARLLEARDHDPRHRRAHNNFGLVRVAWGHSKRPSPRSSSAGLLESGGPAC
jgi:Flp pilus assembly protein TadD